MPPCFARLRNLCILIYIDHIGHVQHAGAKHQCVQQGRLCQWLISACLYAIQNRHIVLKTCFKLASPGMITSKAGCFSKGCQPVPYHLVIAWIKVQALAQSCSSCVPVTHCHVSHSQPKNTHSQTAVAMHAHYLLAARPNLQQFTGELESQTCSILWASFDGVAQP